MLARPLEATDYSYKSHLFLLVISRFVRSRYATDRGGTTGIDGRDLPNDTTEPAMSLCPHTYSSPHPAIVYARRASFCAQDASLPEHLLHNSHKLES